MRKSALHYSRVRVVLPDRPAPNANAWYHRRDIRFRNSSTDWGTYPHEPDPAMILTWPTSEAGLPDVHRLSGPTPLAKVPRSVYWYWLLP
jgi:hypothetical protein